MKNTITREQYERLDKLADVYNEEHDPTGDYEFIRCDINDNGDEQVSVEITAYDWDNNTDFGTLHRMLNEVGVEVDNDAETVTGDAEWGGKSCRIYSYILQLNN